MARIGLIDVDNQDKLNDCFPNLPLMKLSAWHKAQGDIVEWYHPLFSGHMDKVYVGKVFSFTPDYEYFIDADEIVRGGSGYCISLENGKEKYDSSRDHNLPYEIEHIYPDYSIYGIDSVAYGFMSRGCPRGCDFCHVKDKEGTKAYKVADLNEFWNGQKKIVLLDPNTLACREWEDILHQLIDSKAKVDFSQGIDIRLMTEEKAELFKQIKVERLHFAWDRYQDKEMIIPKFELFKNITGISERKLIVYTLCNFNTTIEQDLERIYTLRDMGYWAYVMLYDKEHIPRGNIYKKLQRWVNNRMIFARCKTFEEYLKTY